MDRIITIAGLIFASTGFWSLITYLIQRRDKKVSAEGKMLRGLAHDRICHLGESYIRQGYISRDDYENLYEYLYVPYDALGGNGTARRIIEEVRKLPLRNSQ